MTPVGHTNLEIFRQQLATVGERVLAFHHERGQTPVGYDDLVDVVTRSGGEATAAEVTRALCHEPQARLNYLTLPPPGLSHPALNVVFKLEGERLMASDCR